MAPQVRRYRDVIGYFATGVAIVTCDGPRGPSGMTTNAVASLSLDPLLMLVCFDNEARTLEAVRGAERFAVNVLRAGSEELAGVFASKRLPIEKFEAVTHREAHGVPVLDDALAWLVCDLKQLVSAGDHQIGIGEVIAMEHDDTGDPLVWYRGEYTTVAE